MSDIDNNVPPTDENIYELTTDQLFKLQNPDIITKEFIAVRYKNGIYIDFDGNDVGKDWLPQQDWYPEVENVINAPASSLFDPVLRFFGMMFEGVWNGFQGQMKKIGEEAEKGLKQFFRDWYEDSIKPELQKLVDTGMLSKDVFDIVEQANQNSELYLVLSGIFFNFSAWSNYVTSVTQVLQAPARYQLMTNHRPNILPETNLLATYFRYPEKEQEVKDELKKYGYSDNRIETLIDSTRTLLDVPTIMQLKLRGQFGEKEALELMQKLGYSEELSRKIIKLSEVIPSIQDILYMVGKEAFEPDSIRALGLDAEFPEEVTPWLEKLGLSRMWQEKYWAAHWIQPSISQGYEMFHRDIINYDTLEFLFKAIEIPPFWRDKLLEMAYNPITRVDLRRLYDLGIYDRDMVKKGYKDLGYDDEKAEYLTIFTEQYYEDDERELTKEQIIGLFKRKMVNYEEAVNFLIRLRYPEDKARLLVDLAEFDLEQSLLDSKVNQTKELYAKNLIDYSEFLSRLGTLDIPSARIEQLAEEAAISKIKNNKLPSKADLIKFREQGIIDDVTFMQELANLGYNPKYALWYAQSLGLTEEGGVNE